MSQVYSPPKRVLSPTLDLSLHVVFLNAPLWLFEQGSVSSASDNSNMICHSCTVSTTDLRFHWPSGTILTCLSIGVIGTQLHGDATATAGSAQLVILGFLATISTIGTVPICPGCVPHLTTPGFIEKTFGTKTGGCTSYSNSDGTFGSGAIPLLVFCCGCIVDAFLSPDDCCQFQELLQKMADALHIPLEEVWDSQHQLVDILHASVLTRMALLINDAIFQWACTVWHTPATCAPSLKGVEKKYYVPRKGSEFVFSPPT